MADDKENKDSIKKAKKGTTRHCCYGTCNSDSRYAEKDHMKNVGWIPFPKPIRNREKCERWVRACGRKDFSVDNVKKWTYICTKHFVGGLGPTPGNPDPIPATFTPNEVDRFSRKRKAPTPRVTPVSKRTLFEAAEALQSLQFANVTESSKERVIPSTIFDPIMDVTETTSENDTKEVGCMAVPAVATQETQTTFMCKNSLANKITQIINKNQSMSKPKCTYHTRFFYEILQKKPETFKFYTGLSIKQFEHLFSSLGPATNHLIFWKGSKIERNGVALKRRKLSPKNQMLLTMMKLRHAFPTKDLAYKFSISTGLVSQIVNTWIQFLYKQTECIRSKMFPSKELIKENLPPSFYSFKNVRIIIDCFEIFVESSRDFGEQGNMYSSYKHHTTLKCLVGICPTGGVSFISDVYEGGISDKEIFRKSGLVQLLEPGDLVIADRGFLIRDILQEHQVKLNIPPFLNGRDKLTAYEEVLTKRIAKVRIHVERAIERMKKFRIIGAQLPLCFKPVVTQIVQIIGFLVNYQSPLVS